MLVQMSSIGSASAVDASRNNVWLSSESAYKNVGSHFSRFYKLFQRSVWLLWAVM